MTTKKEDLRKVKISKYDDGSGEHITNGYFHKWIEESEFSGEGQLLNRNFGLVELADSGDVKAIFPTRLKFVDNF
jgi:hypothetical protein